MLLRDMVSGGIATRLEHLEDDDFMTDGSFFSAHPIHKHKGHAITNQPFHSNVPLLNILSPPCR